MDAGNWKNARERLESIEARYPFGIQAQQALIDQAYVNWKDEEPEQALAAIERFQRQYPNSPGSDYMLYLKGRSEEHTSELQSRGHLVCRLLLEKKNIYRLTHVYTQH